MLAKCLGYHVIKQCKELDENLKEFLILKTNFFVFSKHNSNDDEKVHFHIYLELKKWLSPLEIQKIFNVERFCVNIVYCSRKDIIEYID